MGKLVIILVSITIVVLSFDCDLNQGDDLLGIFSPGGDDDSALSNLAISTGELNPNFESLHSTYNVSVDTTVTSVTITATERADNQTIRLFAATIEEGGVSLTSGVASGVIALVEEETEIVVQVTSRSKSNTSVYQISVERVE